MNLNEDLLQANDSSNFGRNDFCRQSTVFVARPVAQNFDGGRQERRADGVDRCVSVRRILRAMDAEDGEHGAGNGYRCWK